MDLSYLTFSGAISGVQKQNCEGGSKNVFPENGMMPFHSFSWILWDFFRETCCFPLKKIVKENIKLVKEHPYFQIFAIFEISFS